MGSRVSHLTWGRRKPEILFCNNLWALPQRKKSTALKNHSGLLCVRFEYTCSLLLSWNVKRPYWIIKCKRALEYSRTETPPYNHTIYKQPRVFHYIISYKGTGHSKGTVSHSGPKMNEWMNEWMCIYIPHISHHVSWRFTILLSEIGRQLVKAPLAATISPYLISLTHPTHAWNER